MTQAEEKIYSAIMELKRDVAIFSTIQQNHEEEIEKARLRLDSHSININALANEASFLKGAIRFAIWAGGSGGVIGLFVLVYQIFIKK